MDLGGVVTGLVARTVELVPRRGRERSAVLDALGVGVFSGFVELVP